VPIIPHLKLIPRSPSDNFTNREPNRPNFDFSFHGSLPLSTESPTPSLGQKFTEVYILHFGGAEKFLKRQVTI
jgi:hypothetical protein